MVELRISWSEYMKRIERVRQEMTHRELDMLLLTNGRHIFYLSHFSHITTERPAVLAVPLDGELIFLGPMLEVDHLSHQTKLVGEVKAYLDYPGERHPIELFAEWLTELGYGKAKIGADNPAGAAGAYGYTGPPLSEKMPDAEFVRAGDILWNMRLIKSSAEINLIEGSAKWGNLAHKLLQEYTAPGLWDAEVSMIASTEACALWETAKASST